jgi:hypothetical protein
MTNWFENTQYHLAKCEIRKRMKNTWIDMKMLWQKTAPLLATISLLLSVAAILYIAFTGLRGTEHLQVVDGKWTRMDRALLLFGSGLVGILCAPYERKVWFLVGATINAAWWTYLASEALVLGAMLKGGKDKALYSGAAVSAALVLLSVWCIYQWFLMRFSYKMPEHELAS